MGVLYLVIAVYSGANTALSLASKGVSYIIAWITSGTPIQASPPSTRSRTSELYWKIKVFGVPFPLGEKKAINLKRNLLFGSILIPILSRIVSMSY